MKTTLRSLLSRRLLSCALIFAGMASAHADILVSQVGLLRISKFRNDGSLLKANFITGVETPTALLVYGQYIYVTSAAGGNQKIARYNLDGTVSNASFIPLTGFPASLTTDGFSLYVADASAGKIAKYSLSTGALQNANLITGVESTQGVVFLGGKLFVTSYGGDYIKRYSLAGGTAEASLALPAGSGPLGLAVSAAGNILVGMYNTGVIGEYTPNFSVVKANRVTGLRSPVGITALPGGKFAVANSENTFVSSYNANGTVANAALVKDLQGPYALAYTGVDTPYPTPAVTVKGAVKRTTTKSQIILRGTAKDATSVKVTNGSKPTKTAKGTTTWTHTVKLKKGKNKITIVSTGKGGTSKKVNLVITRKDKKKK